VSKTNRFKFDEIYCLRSQLSLLFSSNCLRLQSKCIRAFGIIQQVVFENSFPIEFMTISQWTRKLYLLISGIFTAETFTKFGIVAQYILHRLGEQNEKEEEFHEKYFDLETFSCWNENGFSAFPVF
jgi:hypothetical protein